jgi:hypothetical protein
VPRELGWIGQPKLLLLLLQQLLSAAMGAAARGCELGPVQANNLTASSGLLTWSSGSCARHGIPSFWWEKVVGKNFHTTSIIFYHLK